MADINDLLYTNTFLSEETITPEVIQENAKGDAYFQRNLQSRNNVKQYINRNLRTGDQVNVNKNLVHPWPAPDRKNPNPMLSEFGQDVTSDKYLVQKITTINIDSRDRNYNNFNIPNNYEIFLPQVFNNVSRIKLKSIQIPNCIPPVNETNNLFSWIVPSYDDIFNTRQVYFLYPFLKSVTLEQIHTGMLPFKSYFNETQSKYTAAMLYGFYNTIQFRQQFLDTLNTVPRYETDAISQVYVPDSSNYNHFYMSLNPATHHVSLVNRFYISPVLAVQTFGPRATSSNDDIFYHFKETTFGTFDPNAVYILVQNSQLQETFDHIHTNPATDYLNMFPIVCSDIKRIGGMPSSGLNLSNFFSVNLSYTAPVNNEHNYYKIYDKLKINNQVYYRFQLYIKNPASQLVVAPTFTETQIYNPAIASVVNVSCQTNFGTCSTNPNCYVNNYSGIIEAELENTYSFPNFGFAYPFQINYEGVNVDDINRLDPTKCTNYDGTVNTIVRLLGWPVIETNALVIQPNGPIKFIQRNTDNILDSVQNFSNIPSNLTYEPISSALYTPNILPQNLLPIEKLPSGEYQFRSATYIFMRIIIPDINVDEYPVTLIKPYGGRSTNNLDVYYKNPAIFQNFAAGANSGSYFLTKDVNGLYAKIPLNVVATNNISTPINHAEMIFQDKYVNNISNITVQFLDYSGKIINPRSDHSFELEFTEIHTILKDTKQDSRINIVNTNGYIPHG
jgi:hypothetical protein